MLFERHLQDGLKQGTITLAFRRWRRPQVVAGRLYRSPIGMVEVTSVATIGADDISEADLEQSGFPSRLALLHDLGFRPGEDDAWATIYRVGLRLDERPDPRAALAASEALTAADIRDLHARLSRLDRDRSWTRPTLEAIARQPGRRAGDLALQLGWPELQEFKLRVRRLKALGLTLSLRVGYQLSPRGEAYLAAIGGYPASD